MTPSSVLLVTPRWTRDGGVATHVQASAGALASRGIEVHVLAGRVDGAPPPGVQLHHVAGLCRARVPLRERVGDAASLQVEVVHAHQFEDPSVLSLLRRAAPIVISVHGYSACTAGVHHFRPGQECTRAHGPGCVPNLLLRGCAHVRNPSPLPAAYRHVSRGLKALRSADLVISYSSAVDRHLEANGLMRRAIVPLFATVPPAQPPSRPSRPRVVFAGRVIRAKGVAVLIAAARNLDAEFVICGDGRDLESMRALARRLGVAERVRFAGWLAPQQLAQELAQASVVAMPSLWPEPAGLVGIEAHLAGRPVVASDTGGVRDWLAHGVNGLLVKPGDEFELARALGELLQDPQRQDAMGAAGRRVVAERFTAEHHLIALQGAYERARMSWERTPPRVGQPEPAPSPARV